MKNEIQKFADELYDKHLEAGLSTKNITVEFGSKFAKIVRHTNQRTVWGFISLKEFTFGDEEVVPGDLFKAASWKKPAKKKRGNILNGTALYDIWGPLYLSAVANSTKAKINLL